MFFACICCSAENDDARIDDPSDVEESGEEGQALSKLHDLLWVPHEVKNAHESVDQIDYTHDEATNENYPEFFADVSQIIILFVRWFYWKRLIITPTHRISPAFTFIWVIEWVDSEHYEHDRIYYESAANVSLSRLSCFRQWCSFLCLTHCK